MSGDTKRVLEVNQIDNLQGSTQRVKQETTLNNLRGITQRVYVVGGGGEPINNQDKTIIANGSYTADEGYTGLGTVTVNVPNPSTGTMYIISNGTYNVSDKAIANVNVPGAPKAYIECAVSNNGTVSYIDNFSCVKLTDVTKIGTNFLRDFFAGRALPANSIIDLSDITEINGNYALYGTFKDTTGIKEIKLGSLTKISGDNSFYSFCEHNSAYNTLTNIDLHSLKTVTGSYHRQAFYYCNGLTSVDLGSLEYVNTTLGLYNWFNNCANLENVNLSNLTTVIGTEAARYMFGSCSKLKELHLYSLHTINGENAMGYFFNKAGNNITVWFHALRSVVNAKALYYFLNSQSNSTGHVIHFPKNLDPQTGSTVISSLQTYPTFCGSGGSATLLYDLPSTFLLTGANSTVYERSPKDDTATALAWRKNQYDSNGCVVDWTPFYTSTLNDPAVNDTIYSDVACTTAVTTISSIA